MRCERDSCRHVPLQPPPFPNADKQNLCPLQPIAKPHWRVAEDSHIHVVRNTNTGRILAVDPAPAEDGGIRKIRSGSRRTEGNG